LSSAVIFVVAIVFSLGSCSLLTLLIMSQSAPDVKPGRQDFPDLFSRLSRLTCGADCDIVSSVGEDSAARRGGKPNEAARAQARELAAAGAGTAQITSALADGGVTVTRRQVQRWCAGLLPGPGARPAEVDQQAVAGARADGASWREVERRTGVKRDTARRRAGSAG
jgi:hypothetical protein